MGVKLGSISLTKERTLMEGFREQGAEENVWI